MVLLIIAMFTTQRHDFIPKGMITSFCEEGESTMVEFNTGRTVLDFTRANG